MRASPSVRRTLYRNFVAAASARSAPRRTSIHSESAGTGAGGAGVIVTTAVELLFAGFGSASVAETVAVFDTDPVGGALIASVTVTVEPEVIVPTLQVTVVVPVQLPCVDEAEEKVVPAGSASATATFVAVLGPLLCTVIV
jgi:hypothetical protein